RGGPFREPRPLEDAHRPVPENRARFPYLCRERLARLWTDVEAEPPFGYRICPDDLRIRLRIESGGRDEVHRKYDLLSGLDLLGHFPADEHGVRLLGQRLEHADLVLHLRASKDRHERALRVLQERAELFELALQ